jgi:hypothetical protein
MAHTSNISRNFKHQYIVGNIDFKICTKCKIQKEYTQFVKDKHNKTGYKSHCKSCVKEYQLTVKDSFKEYQKKWQEENKEKRKEYRQNHYILNKENTLNKCKIWYNNNKEKKLNSCKEYKKNNLEKFKNYQKDYVKNKRQNDDVFKFKSNVRNLIGLSFKRGKNNFIKKLSSEEILGCTIEEFRNYIALQFKSGMNFKNYGEWHLDHIVPLSIAKSEEEIIKLNHYTNFQPLWALDNLIKSDKINNVQLKLV